MGHAGRRGAGLSATVRGGVRKERLLVVKSPLAPCSENCAPECDSPLQNQEEIQARGRSRKDAEKGTRKEIEELQAQGRSRVDAEIGTLKKEIEELQAQGRSMEDAEKGTLKKEIEELQAQGRSMEDAEKGTLKKEIVCAEEPRAKNGILEKENEELRAKYEELQARGRSRVDAEIGTLKKEIEELRAKYEELQARGRSRADAEIGTLKKEIEELRAKYEELQAQGRSRADAEIGTLKKEIEELCAKSEELQAQGRSMEDAEKGTLKKEIEELQAQGRSMEDAEKGTLKKEIVCAEEPRAKNGAPSKESGACPQSFATEGLPYLSPSLCGLWHEELCAKNGILEKENEELRAKYEELQARGRSRVDAEIGTLKKEIEELRAKYEELQAQGRSMEDAEKGTLKKEIEELQAQGRSMEDAEKGTLKKEIVCAEEPRAKNGILEKENEELRAKYEELQARGRSRVDAEIGTLKKEIEELRAKYEELQARGRSRADAEIGTLKKEIEELRAKYEELQAQGRSRADAEIGTLKKEIEELCAKSEELQAQGRSMEDAEKGTLKKEIVCAEEPRAKNGAPSKESGACPQSFATEGLPYLSPSLCGLWHEELCAKNGILEKENEELRAKYEELQARGRSRVDAEIGTLKKEIEELRAKYEELQARGRSGVDAEIGTLKKEIDVSILIAADAEVLAEPSGTHVSQERSGWPHHETGSRSQAPAATSSGIPSDVCFLASLETLSLRPRMGLTAVIFLLVLASRHQPTAGVGHDPLLVVDDYEDGGIRLKCLSERLFSEAQLLWTDSRGDNITGTPLSADTGTAGVSSSIVLKAGSGNSMSCRILDKQLKTSTESSVAIADAFFPSTSPWLAAFVVILLLSIFLVLAAIYKIRNNNKEITRAQNARKQIEQDIDELKRKLDEQERRFEKENEDAEKRIENVRNELKFRKARSNAVNITLDQKCKHPNLCISDDKRRVKSSDKKETALKAMVVATEGFPDKKHYWEVEVGNQSQWELGVVSENVRNMIMNNMGISPPVNGLFSLQYSQGKYILTGREDVSDCKQCSVVGVLLDVESSELSFYSVEEMSPLGSVVLEFTGKLYPFFSPDSSGKWLGVRPVKPQTYDPLPQGEKEINK
ncbi:myosin heavy chain, non-muscle isoform X44 [Gallus gallus]|uniref:myosin heavy chain, non-muscle isoform X42 n=1 Tax=Gallus gallus TaxID=9031 RepID=UPI001AE11529|nr:myosin heavy chain, non-muscle isoform X42 [Gallus gallus]XP_040549231.1 myosin heavy chain, non-muscle isoform X44 [Gallus gallus]